MEYRTSSVTVSKKLSNGHSFSGKSMYDGVFAAPSKFGVPTFSSRVEDYSEIFGGSGASRGSSIPILEIPELNERKIAVDVGTSKLDYSKIFGGFGDSDFAVPYEELQTEQNKREIFADEPLNPDLSERLPCTKDADTCSEENHALAREASCQSFNGVKKFSVSYQKTNNGNENGFNGTTHIAQLHAVPGYTCLIDEVTPSRMTKGDNPVSSVVNGACPGPKDNIFVGKMEGNDVRKAKTDLPSGGTAGTETSKGNVEFQNKSNRSRSNSMDELFDACEVGNGIRHPKVRPSSSFPSNYGNNYDGSRKSMASKFWSFKIDASEGSASDYSLPLFDEEVDTNSVAATSMAALKKAIEEAQARMKIAKVSMERKKSGIQSRVKVGFGDGLKDEERKEVKVAEKENGSKKKMICDTCEEQEVPLHISVGTGKQNTTSPGQVITDFEVQEKILKSGKEADSEAMKEFRSIQADHRQEDADIFEESEQFYEVFKEADEEIGNEFSFSHENYKQEEADTFEEEEQFYEVTNTGNQWDTFLEFEEEKDAKKAMQFVDTEEWKEKKIAKEVFDQPEKGGERLKPTEGEGNLEEMENYFKELDTVKLASDCEKYGRRLAAGVNVFDQVESEERLKVAYMQGETEKKVQAFCEDDECQKEHKELQEPIKDEKILGNLEAKDVELLERQPVVWESVENKNKGEETSKQEELERELKDAHERRFNKASKQDTFVGRLDDFNQREDIEKRLIYESHLEKEEEFQQVVEDEKIVEVDAYQDEENEKTFKVDVHQEDEIEEIIKLDVYQEEENGKIQENMCELVEAGGLEETKIEPSAGDGKLKVTNEDLRNQENNIEEDDNLCKHDERDNLNKIQKPTVSIENKQGIEGSMEIPACEERGSLTEVTEVLLDPEENRKELELIEEYNDMVEREMLETDCLVRGFKLTNIIPMEDVIKINFLSNYGINLDVAGMGFVQKQHDQQTRDFDIVCNSGKQVESSVPELEKMNEDVKETEVSMNHADEETESKCFEEERWVEDGINIGAAQHDQETRDFENVCNLGKSVESLVPELEKMNEDVKETEVSMNHADEENETKCFEEERWVENGINIAAAQFYEISEVEEENVGLDQEIKTSLYAEKDHENNQETLTDESAEMYVENYQETLTSLNAEKEEKHYGTLPNQDTQHHDQNHQETQKSQRTETKEENQPETLNLEEGETNETLQKEEELEKEQLKKIDQAKEREREKERIAVERAIREARERAFAEAKERAAAERAAAEARRRLLAAEARERFGKDPVEANDKSLADKAKEAKRNAERAAVERALAEARVRALEKAMSSKAASETRKQTERFASEKVSGDPSPSSTSSVPNSLNHGAPYSTERFDQVNGESAQRCKARLERHQRTAERAAKALAEKNMRDLLAQKEQAERNRLAEVLDAEIKRWSGGKEGNLRALLSTLQYILGPDSGWQPVPLTDIITSIAVKKAYRKATLFVHPDKMQQRGASIQQKYTCEKVFDLLKEAWNRFNMEER
ncbi:hypothetical protein FEM48_Zijuj06G0084400 [Ziziphus jujuba var. spinosa]|uniref:Auxilin-like protein 1 n=1 Tax=Ziziphus jujuba var. spinosa TaxID=714518 RepID=A0A978V877_ZIZJJ|nr:hypothetical protein FEM48_Zijuj06G0084400 [Ziziphus jujuba var. spinosa]